MTDSQTGARRGAPRRLTFTQTPYTAEFSEKLATATDMTKADLYNTGMQVLSVILGACTGASADGPGPLYRDDPALKVLLGDILISLRDRERQQGS